MARFQTTVTIPPPDAARIGPLQFVTGDRESFASDRYRSNWGTWTVLDLNVRVLSAALTDTVPKSMTLPWTIALFSSGVPVVRLLEATFGRSARAIGDHIATVGIHDRMSFRTGTKCRNPAPIRSVSVETSVQVPARSLAVCANTAPADRTIPRQQQSQRAYRELAHSLHGPSPLRSGCRGNANALVPMTTVAGVPPFHSGGTCGRTLEYPGKVSTYPSQQPCARCGSHRPLGLLIRKFFSIIAQIRVLYVENFGIMASRRRRPEDGLQASRRNSPPV